LSCHEKVTCDPSTEAIILRPKPCGFGCHPLHTTLIIRQEYDKRKSGNEKLKAKAANLKFKISDSMKLTAWTLAVLREHAKLPELMPL
jgi:hypothetical protein